MALLSRSIVPAVQARGGDPTEVQQAQPPHEADGAERALPLPLAGRGGHPVAEGGQAPAGLEAPAQLDVIHQRDVRIATHRLEVGAPQEDSLATSANARGARARVHEPGDHSEATVATVEHQTIPISGHPRAGGAWPVSTVSVRRRMPSMRGGSPSPPPPTIRR